MKGSCRRCGGKGRLDVYRTIQEGRCFECHGTGESDRQGGYQDRDFEPARKLPMLTEAEARRLADQALAKTARFFEYGSTPAFRRNVREGIEDEAAHYHGVGKALGWAVVEPERFARAVFRARARVPAAFMADFQDGLEGAVAEASDTYEGIEV